MKRNIELIFKVQVDFKSEEEYGKIIENVLNLQKDRFGMEFWELEQLLNPISPKNPQRLRRTYFPINVETDNGEDLTTKIEFIG